MAGKSHEQSLPVGRLRPHSFDIGVYEHQGHMETVKQAKGRGIYKSGNGTFMFASTSMSAALDNLQFYPRVSALHTASLLETTHQIRSVAPDAVQTLTAFFSLSQ